MIHAASTAIIRNDVHGIFCRRRRRLGDDSAGSCRVLGKHRPAPGCETAGHEERFENTADVTKTTEP